MDIVHAFTPSSMSEWEGLAKEYLQRKEKYFSFLIEKISTIPPNLEQNIDHKKLVPKTHKKFLGRVKVVMVQFQQKVAWTFTNAFQHYKNSKPLLCRFMLPCQG